MPLRDIRPSAHVAPIECAQRGWQYRNTRGRERHVCRRAAPRRDGTTTLRVTARCNQKIAVCLMF